MKTNVDLYKYERVLWDEGLEKIMGLDEVGRGCLAGPVVAAGVILDKKHCIKNLNDSKILDEMERISLAEQIKKHALHYSIQYCDVEEISRLNILWASLTAMQKCVEACETQPDYLLIDGNRYMDTLIPHTCLVKGDARSASIAAASILAKVHRDKLMRELHKHYPHFGWNTNVGYPTKKHYEGLKKHGYTPVHRPTFNLKTVMVYKAKDSGSQE